MGTLAAQTTDPVLVRIGKKEFTRTAFESFYNSRTESARSQQGVAEALDDFVKLQLALSRARELGLDTTAFFRSELSAERINLLKSSLGEDEEPIRQLYEQQKGDGRTEQIEVMQLFKRLPQNIQPAHLATVEAQMDSLYQILSTANTLEFSRLVASYSDDTKRSWIGRMEVPNEFEEQVFALQKGTISAPFYTPQGVHIVTVLDRREAPALDEMRAEMERRFAVDPAYGKEREVRLQALKERLQYSPVPAAIEELLRKGESDQILFTLQGEPQTGADFSRFAANYPRGIQRQFDAFVMKTMLDYEKRQLEQNHPAFGKSAELEEKALMRAVREREGLTKERVTEADLAAYFQAHASDYRYETPRYHGAVFYCIDKKTAKTVRKVLKRQDSTHWKELLQQQFGSAWESQIRLVEGEFSLGDHAAVDRFVFKKRVTPNPPASHPIVLVMGRKKTGPDRYQEVYDAVKLDYLEFRERLWIRVLRASAPVAINQEVLKTVNNH